MEKEDLVNYLHDNGVQGEIICYQLETKGVNKAFRIGIPFNSIQMVNEPEFWPVGILIRQYIFGSQRSTGIRLYRTQEERRNGETVF
ncbi:hypothetical protein C0J52_28439 [Blattella germanica]|nr:hypothetical protein C0J52_28439 [Blattella germanica]